MNIIRADVDYRVWKIGAYQKIKPADTAEDRANLEVVIGDRIDLGIQSGHTF